MCGYTNEAFIQNLAVWNVLSVTNLLWAFDGTTLSSSTKGRMYSMWGTTLQAAYPTWACGSFGMPTCITNANIAAAVTAWVTSAWTGGALYGPIEDWNTAAVTSMYQVFQSQSLNENDDISKWNTASVSNMASVCAAFGREHALQ